MLVVTGIRTDSDKREACLDCLEQKLGTSGKLIVNSSSGAFLDICFSVVGILSSSLGARLEKEATRALYASILKELRDKGEVKLFVHSQGSIITANALTQMRERFISQGRKEAWDSLASRISITAIGAAMHLWPKEIGKVTSFAHEGDIVPKITLPVLRLYQKFLSPEFRFVSPKISQFPGSGQLAHSFFSYVKTSIDVVEQLEKVSNS